MVERDSDLVTVFSGDFEDMVVAESILSGQGIEYFTGNVTTQSLFGEGRIGTGYNVITGAMHIDVRPADAERAKDLLMELGNREKRLLTTKQRIILLALSLGPALVILILRLITRR